MKLCLCMIVKDEAARIERCLASVKLWISCWSITDTGSTDGTQELVTRLLGDLPGRISATPFVNFGATRNYGLGLAHESGAYDYLLLVDADMELVVEDRAWVENLTAPAYKLLQKNTGLSYWNVRLLKRDTAARYIGVTHEYLSIEGDSPNLSGAWFIDHADGSNRAGKFERDAVLLKGEIAQQARSWYYLGQSQRDMGDKKAAAASYGIRASLGGWEEEIWHAELSRSRCLHDYGAPEWVDVALSAYGKRPTRAEPLYDLARHFRERGLNEASLLFSERGLGIPRPADDLLFVEDAVYAHGLREEFAICAFYSERHRTRGQAICNDLALDRGVPQQVRETAWRNLFFYTGQLAEVAPSFQAQRIDFKVPDGYRPCNPSVCRVGDTVYLNIRAVNYLIGQDGRYIMPVGEPEIRTRNLLFSLGPDLRPILLGQIRAPLDLPPPAWGGVLGFEDVRLFERDGALWGAASTRQCNPGGWAEMFVARIDAGGGNFIEWHVARPEGPRRHEKNWMPLADGNGFVYMCDPTVIVNLDGSTRQTSTPPIAADAWGGSSQLIPFDGGYLALIHERKADPDPMHGQRNYQRRFVWFDENLTIKHWSQRFTFGDGEGEFACGMCWHPDERRLIISYGVLDREAWVATVDANEVRRLMGFPQPTPLVATDDMKRRYQDALNRYWAAKTPREERAAYADFRAAGGLPSYGEDDAWRPEIARDEPRRLVPRLIPELPAHCDRGSYSWALANTNRPLRTQDEVDVATAHLRNLGLPEHGSDRPKNWDNLIAVAHATATTAKDGMIMDAGGDRKSAFLRGLRSFGYTKLHNVNLEERYPGYDHDIRYHFGDVTKLAFVNDGGYDFIACLSVIEHGVDVRAFLREMARIIKPGGHLFLSFDYWVSSIDCGDRMAFGAPVRVFARDDVIDMLFYAGDQGLLPAGGEVQYECGERVVSWIGLEFTFMNLLLRRA